MCNMYTVNIFGVMNCVLLHQRQIPCTKLNLLTHNIILIIIFKSVQSNSKVMNSHIQVE